MFSLKRIVLALLTGLLLYVLGMVAVDVLLARQKSAIEAFLAQQFPDISITIERLYNMPFVFFGAKNVVLRTGETGSLVVRRVRIFYLPNIFWDPVRSVYRIEIDSGEGDLVINELFRYFTASSSFSLKGFYPTIVVTKSDFRISFWQTLFARFQVDRALFRMKPIGWEGFYTGDISIFDVYGMEYLRGSGNLRLLSYGPHWWNTLVESGLSLSVGGFSVALLTNLRLDLSLYRQHDLVVTNATEEFHVDFQNETFSYRQKGKLEYSRLGEKGIFEHYFSPGEYLAYMTWEKQKSLLEISLKGSNSQMFSFNSGPERGEFTLNTKKGGQARARWQNLSSGMVLDGQCDSLMVIPNFLFLSGKVSLVSKGQEGSLVIHDFAVNGGKTGSSRIQYHFETNELVFVSDNNHNLRFSGRIGKDVSVDFEGRDIEGKALSKTVFFSGFDLERMKLSTKGSFFMTPRGEISIFGKMQGKLFLQGRSFLAGTDYTIFVPTPTNTHVFLSNLFLSREGIQKGVITVDVNYPERRWMYITMTGNARFPLLGQTPFELKYTWDGLEENGKGNLLVKTNIQVRFEHTLEDGRLDWEISSMPFYLSKSLSSFVQSRGFYQWKKGFISGLEMRTTLFMNKTPYELRLKLVSSNNALQIENFWLNLQGDVLIGKGMMAQTRTGLDAQVFFIRGGGVRLRMEEQTWQMIGDFRKVGIRFPDGSKYILDVVGKLQGQGMDFDAEGQVIMAGENVEIALKDVKKIGSRLDIYNITGKWQGWEMSGDGFWDIKRQQGGWNFFLSAQDKKLFQMQFIGAYEQKEAQYFFSYRVPNWIFFGKPQPSFSGEVLFKQDEVVFTKKQLYGFNGMYKVRDRALNVEYLFPFVSGNLSGSMGQTLNLTSRNRASFDFLDKWWNIRVSGAMFAQISLTGSQAEPSLGGSLQLQGVSLTIPGVVTKITNQYLTLSFSGDEIVLPRQKLATSTGVFWIQGAMKPFQNGLFSFRLGAQRSSDVFRFQTPVFTGVIQPEILTIGGSLDDITVGGNLRLRQSRIWVSLQDFWSRGNEFFLPVQLALSVFLDQRLAFQSEVVDMVFEPGSVLKISGALPQPSLKGKLSVASGRLRYLTQNFQIVEGIVSFENDFLPEVEFQSKYRYRSLQDNIEIYLTFLGKLPKINLVNFYSVPERRKEEIISYLGLPQMVTNTNVSSQTVASLFSTGAGLAEEVLILSPFSARLRQQLGLDMFVIRSTLAQNYARYLTGGISNLTLPALLEGTSLSVGRYILPNIFVEADIALQGVFGSNQVTLRPVYSFGVSYSLQGVEVGWSYEPLLNTTETLEYEQKIEINYKRRF
ncbi:translocation/assembly module TamB domain-containing protein [Thermospira aquatica]|uniref:Translocation/assembly module TamB domain-containing protein n=1 Tax=Thermospira aquatica TaxID=2828656 RepID=A0AAX3BC62_9SPIR|nr:translocation/assembly module TamB domain-containing protein [Thermospira aquatica]URA09876.1 translocation/assembly module TamB domain-containing protein [Thermospira aquatica]